MIPNYDASRIEELQRELEESRKWLDSWEQAVERLEGEIAERRIRFEGLHRLGVSNDEIARITDDFWLASSRGASDGELTAIKHGASPEAAKRLERAKMELVDEKEKLDNYQRALEAETRKQDERYVDGRLEELRRKGEPTPENPNVPISELSSTEFG